MASGAGSGSVPPTPHEVPPALSSPDACIPTAESTGLGENFKNTVHQETQKKPRLVALGLRERDKEQRGNRFLRSCASPTLRPSLTPAPNLQGFYLQSSPGHRVLVSKARFIFTFFPCQLHLLNWNKAPSVLCTPIAGSQRAPASDGLKSWVVGLFQSAVPYVSQRWAD